MITYDRAKHTRPPFEFGIDDTIQKAKDAASLLADGEKQSFYETLAARFLAESIRFRGHQTPQDEPKTTPD